MNPKKLLVLLTLVFFVASGLAAGQRKREESRSTRSGSAVNADKTTGGQTAGQGIGAEAAFVVSKTADTNDHVCDSDCSLREAIEAANLSVGADTITFDAALTVSPATITLSGTSLDILEEMTIAGPGADRLTIDANGLSRVFTIDAAATAEISGISMTGGFDNGDGGGGIYSEGNLTLRAVHMYGNDAFSGGAILNWGFDTTMLIYDSTFSNNTAVDVAGAIYTAERTEMYNSTVSGNTSASFIGGIFIEAGSGVSHTIQNSTITGNSADEVGGIWSFNTNVSYGSTIIAGNSSNFGEKDYTGSAPISLGYNLVGIVSNAAWFTAVGDQKGSSASPLDPILSPLANYGGPTPTHAFNLSLGISPAIDKGVPLSRTLDQRGYQRTVDLGSVTNAPGGLGTDIGAYELQAPTAAPVTITGRVLTSAGKPINKAVVTLTTQDGSTVRATTNAKGNFRFEGVEAGEGYILSVQHKRYRFNTTFVNAESDVTELDIYAR